MLQAFRDGSFYIVDFFLSAARLPLVVFMLMNVAFNNPSPRRKHYLIETEDENSEDEVSKTLNKLPKHFYKE